MQGSMISGRLLQVLCTFAAATAVHASLRRAGLRGVGGALSPARPHVDASDLDQVVEAMVGLNSSRRPRGAEREPEFDLDAAVQQGAAELDLATALEDVRAAQPPAEVLAVLAHMGSASSAQVQGAGASSVKKSKTTHGTSAGKDAKEAVVMLNDMIVKAQERLGNKSVECREFQEDFQRDLDRVKGDLAHMGMERSNLNRMMTASMGAIDSAMRQAQGAKERLATQELHYKEQLARDQEELETRTKDLEASTFMLDLTACGSLLQGGGSGSSETGGSKANVSQSVVAVRICKNTTGVSEVYFKDPRLSNASASLSSDARRLLYVAVARAEKVREGHGLDDAELGLLSESSASHPSEVPMDLDKQSRKCIQAESGCGPLHDTMGTLWSDMKELVDDTKEQIRVDTASFNAFRDGINEQLRSISSSIKEQQGALQQATTAGGTLSQHQQDLVSEKEDLERMSWNKHRECKTTIREILFKQICAIHKVRDELVRINMKDVSVAELTDCYVTEFVESSCSKNCDDDMVGGTMNMSRDIITKNNELGAPCPALLATRPCNRKKCPVDCRVSEWSSWSKCTSDCGGGVQSRMRALEQKPKYDGQACNTLQETQVCNTGACDRDCTLSEWSEWSRCDMACNSGFRSRTRAVVEEALGKGACPHEDDPERTERKECNTQPCPSDESCVGELDVILAIDSSGSLGEEGFKSVRTFASMIVDRFEPKAYGREAVHAGAVMFGNGHIDKDKVMSDAVLVSPLTDDMGKLKESIEGLEWQKGMTNLAQGVQKARTALKTGARMNAQTVVILITDGRMAFKSQVAKAVEDIKKSSRMLVVHVQSHPMEDYVNLLKGFASQPWMTNYMLVRGRQLLNADYTSFVNSVLARTCKKIESPSAVEAHSQSHGYRLTLEGFSCGPGDHNSMQRSPEACLKAAYKADPKFKSFAFGGKPGPAPGTRNLSPMATLSADDTPYFVYECQVYSKDCTEESAQSNATFNVYDMVKVNTSAMDPSWLVSHGLDGLDE